VRKFWVAGLVLVASAMFGVRSNALAQSKSYGETFVAGSSLLRMENRSVGFFDVFPDRMASHLSVNSRAFRSAWRITDVGTSTPTQFDVTIIDFSNGAAAQFALEQANQLKLAGRLPAEKKRIVLHSSMTLRGQYISLASVQIHRLVILIAGQGPQRAAREVDAIVERKFQQALTLRASSDEPMKVQRGYRELTNSIFSNAGSFYMVSLLLVQLRDRPFRRIWWVLRQPRSPVRRLRQEGFNIVDLTRATRKRWLLLGFSSVVLPWFQFQGAFFAVVSVVVASEGIWTGFALLAVPFMVWLARKVRSRANGAGPQLRYRQPSRVLGRGWLFIGNSLTIGFFMVFFLLVFSSGSLKYFVDSLRNTEFGKASASLQFFASLFAVLAVVASTRVSRFFRQWVRRSFAKVLSSEQRPAVLLLRSFADDGLRLRTRRSARHSLSERLSFRRFDSFDEVLSWSLWRYGPVRTAAQPGRSISSSGALQQNFADSTWEQSVSTLILNSPFIVVSVSSTESLDWEIKELLRLGATDRTVFFLPPIRNDAEMDRRLAQLSETLGVPLLTAHQREGQFVTLALRVRPSTEVEFMTARRRDEITYSLAVEHLLKDPLIGRPLEFPSAADPTKITSTAKPQEALVDTSLRRQGIFATCWFLLTLGLLGCSGFGVYAGAMLLRTETRKVTIPPPSYLPGFGTYPPPLSVVAADNGFVLSADRTGDVLVLDLARVNSERNFVQGVPTAVALRAGRAAVAFQGESKVEFWTLGAMKNRQNISVPFPSGLAVSDSFVVTTSLYDRSITVISSDGAPVTVKVPGRPGAVTIVGAVAHVVDQLANNVTTIDLVTHRVATKTVATCDGPVDIQHSKTLMVIACANDGKIHALSLDLSKQQFATVGGSPKRIGISNNNTVTVLHRNGTALLMTGNPQRLRTGARATDMAVDAKSGRVLLVMPVDNQIGVENQTDKSRERLVRR
jgi:hypothetical protein